MTFNSISELRKNRGGFDRMMKEVEKLSTASANSNEDTRFWQPEVDKNGNGYAVIRFLPSPRGEDLPWVQLWTHGFKGPTGKWYIENSLTTLGKPDPVTDFNTQLWNSTTDDKSPAREQARKQKRKLVYLTNILVVRDPANPENEGKVFLFKFGPKIFQKLKDVMRPEFEDEKPMNPFDFWDGANFKLKISNVANYRNYDKSEFDKPSQIADSDEEIERIWKSEYSLKELISADKFKSYDDLKRRLEIVLGSTATSAVNNEEEAPKPKKAAPAPRRVDDDEDDDDTLSYFSNLANED